MMPSAPSSPHSRRSTTVRSKLGSVSGGVATSSLPRWSSPGDDDGTARSSHRRTLGGDDRAPLRARRIDRSGRRRARAHRPGGRRWLHRRLDRTVPRLHAGRRPARVARRGRRRGSHLRRRPRRDRPAGREHRPRRRLGSTRRRGRRQHAAPRCPRTGRRCRRAGHRRRGCHARARASPCAGRGLGLRHRPRCP